MHLAWSMGLKHEVVEERGDELDIARCLSHFKIGSSTRFSTASMRLPASMRVSWPTTQIAGSALLVLRSATGKRAPVAQLGSAFPSFPERAYQLPVSSRLSALLICLIRMGRPAADVVAATIVPLLFSPLLATTRNPKQSQTDLLPGLLRHPLPRCPSPLSHARALPVAPQRPAPPCSSSLPMQDQPAKSFHRRWPSCMRIDCCRNRHGRIFITFAGCMHEQCRGLGGKKRVR
ncbi:hypothetical protein GALMADRAFT_922500 [Galerina marginata CBS 339.88]|uniref:Uncharacterized protein n=1 Tax=Galerina marginata (strain CBS 339.88) TaxID=685588 RepID=A0A067SF22_GALM3|nr:hypothetical protein GALMADRAFT_922500 [Galerina marginata CBS 339.88]